MTTQPANEWTAKRVALLSFACVAFPVLLASLWSFDPADPPSDYVFPANEQITNWCGPAGARLAFHLIHWLGFASILVCAATGWNGGRLFWREPSRRTATTVLGTLLLIPVGAGCIHGCGIETKLCSVAGPGGIAGAFVFHSLSIALSPFGTFLVLVPLTALSTYLAFEGLLPALRSFVSAVVAVALAIVRGLFGLLSFAKRQPASVAATVAEPAEDPIPVKLSIVEEPDAEADTDDDPADRWEHPRQELRIVRTYDGDGDQPAEPPVPVTDPSTFQLPELDLLDDPEPFDYSVHEEEIRDRAKLLERTFAEFQMKVKVVQIDTGPVVTQYEIELEPGLRARKVMALSDDLAIAMKAPNVRIVAPIPGKNTVGIEVPNEQRAKVGLKEVITKSPRSDAMRLPLYLGKDVKGQPLVCDLANMPHLLIAGRTGTGKSVCLNALILSILMTRSPEQVKMLMIDPKMVELSLYKDIPHLLHPVVTDMRKAEALLAWAVDKMEERYDLLARAGVRHIDSYNKLSPEELRQRLQVSTEETASFPTHLPYILIFADEMADLMMTAAKQVEAHIIRLAQKSRAVGIHLVLATQKPTVDVITGLIKSNLPARIAFQVASRSDSRVVLDEMGADKLLGNGDMLFLYPGTSKIVRAQGTFVSDEEVQRMTQFLKSQGRPQYSRELIELQRGPAAEKGSTGNLADRDELYEAAIEVVVREQRGSVSLLQRALGIGYGRAARLIDYMAEDGIVGEYNGSQAREVLFTPEAWEEARERAFGKSA